MITLGVIPKHFPVRVTVTVLSIIAGGVAAMALLIYLSSHMFIGDTYLEGLRNLSLMKRVLLQKSLLICLITSTFIMGGIVLLTLFYSHRIAGPLYRLKVSARTIADGDYTVTVRLREKDVVHSLADSLNLLTGRYRKRLLLIGERVAALKEAARAAAESAGKGENGELEEAIERLYRASEELRMAVGDIKT